MPTIFEVKERSVTDAPLLVFECTLPDGRTERWSTHGATIDGQAYEPRILQHNVFEIQTASDQGVDGIPRVSLVLANADGHFSEIERAGGWKGARLTVSFLFYDLRGKQAASDRQVVFQGICNPPDEIREGTFRITATNRMSLQRLLLPQVRIQRRCPWEFPATIEQREEAVNGGPEGKYSRYFRCGYSADVPGGVGTLSGGAPFTSCGYTRADCEARGMFSNFGGIEFVPSTISVRSFGDKSWHQSAVTVNGARYNDFVPMIYGTAWYAPPVVFARNDGNLTRMEVLLGMGEMQGVLKVLVNDVDIPAGVAGTNMTGTGWYNVMTLGTRAGTPNPDFTNASGQAAGDPYGSMAYLSVVVPNRLNDGTSAPRVRVLAQGLKLPQYTSDGTPAGEQFTNNPAWILLDILRRSGWKETEIDLASFAKCATFCEEPIPTLDVHGNPITTARFQCNLPLENRRSAGDLVRGVRNSARLLLTYGLNGALELRAENTTALENPVKPAWSNSKESLDGGWPSYEFGDGSNGISGVLRNSNGEPTLRVFSRPMADTPNRFSVEFQDGLNEYQQDSLSMVDSEDVARTGQEVAAGLSAIGLPNYDQAARILRLNLDKSIRGNTYIEFQSSVKGFGVRPGDLMTMTYLKEGFHRQPFRVLKIAPGTNHRLVTVMAQIHDDAWYDDSRGQVSPSGGRRTGSLGIGIPRQLMGSVLDSAGEVQFGVEEAAGDTASETSLTVSFIPPETSSAAGPGIPLVGLAAHIRPGGTLAGGQTLYYAVAGCDAAGNESGLSFVVAATIIQDDSSVIISGLSFAPGTDSFHVYRGSSPSHLFRIASDQPIASDFTDTGVSRQLTAPPDPNFDHANFYWRMELQPESVATIHSANTIGNSDLQMTDQRYRGSIARVTSGRGAGQERAIAANIATTLTVSPRWDIEPDASSRFVVAENGWRFGALSKSSPVTFAVPNRGGETVHICGRAANVNDAESSAEEAILTRWQIGGNSGGDKDVPPKPYFALEARRSGTVELNGVSFADLTNTQTITSATLTLYYYDELKGNPGTALAAGVISTDTVLELSSAGGSTAGDCIQVEGEVMQIEAVENGGTRYRVKRGWHSSQAADHASSEPIYALTAKAIIAPFPPGFFGSPYAGSWSYPISLPDVRVASAEMFVTNSRGDSVTSSICVTNNQDLGLRTFSGGQYSIQVSGFLAVDAAAAPPLVIEASHTVREIYAVLGRPADGPITIDLNVDGAPYCSVQFAAGMTISDAVDGTALAPLIEKSTMTLAVRSVGFLAPGADLTVLIRL